MKEARDRAIESEEHKKVISKLQKEIDNLVITLNDLISRQSQSQKIKQKVYESKRISELEAEINNLTASLHQQRIIEASLRVL